MPKDIGTAGPRRWSADEESDRSSGAAERADSTADPSSSGRRRPGRYFVKAVAVAVASGLVVAAWAYIAQPPPARVEPPVVTLQCPELPPELLDSTNSLQVEAVKLADRLVLDFPNDVEALHLRGLILNRFVSHVEAVRCWKECVQHDPQAAESYYWLGRELFRQGLYEEAIANYRRACELGSSIADARIQLADALISRGKIEEAVSVLQEQVRAEPAVTAGHCYLGQAYGLLGRLDEAEASYRRALETNSDCHQALYGLAMISQKRGDAEAARGHIERFRKLQAQFFVGHQELKRDRDDAESLQGGLAVAYTDAGRLYLDKQATAQAEACWTRAAQVDPQDIDSRKLLIDLYYRQNQPKPCLQLLEQLSRIEPNNPMHGLNLGMVHLALGQLDQAEEVLSQLVKAQPQRAEGYLALSELYLRQGKKLPEAVALAQQGVDLQPVAKNYAVLSRACAANGDRAGSRAAIERAAELDPANATYRLLQAQSQSDRVESP